MAKQKDETAAWRDRISEIGDETKKHEIFQVKVFTELSELKLAYKQGKHQQRDSVREELSDSFFTKSEAGAIDDVLRLKMTSKENLHLSESIQKLEFSADWSKAQIRLLHAEKSELLEKIRMSELKCLFR
ncbi:MAG: hypothetical protein H8D55_02700 [Deltaproteobacteria bacterium]|nr:hypothetical protein [Deltaproteobacteria bacterium]